jgi:hypothetical protein
LCTESSVAGIGDAGELELHMHHELPAGITDPGYNVDAKGVDRYSIEM